MTCPVTRACVRSCERGHSLLSPHQGGAPKGSPGPKAEKAGGAPAAEKKPAEGAAAADAGEGEKKKGEGKTKVSFKARPKKKKAEPPKEPPSPPRLKVDYETLRAINPYHR